jgi:AcrR family transcriptional regulator
MAARGRPRSFDRDAALREALDLFWVRGYDGTSLADLTTAMGINAPSLYAAFGCKEALFRETVELYAATYGQMTIRPLQDGATARESVEGMLRAAAEYMSADGPAEGRASAASSASRSTAAPEGAPRMARGCLIAIGGLHWQPGHEDVRQEFIARRAEARDGVRQRLTRAIAAGELPAGIDTAGIAAFYSTVLNGLSVQARDGASRATMLAIVSGAMAAWDSLVAQPRAPRSRNRPAKAPAKAPRKASS